MANQYQLATAAENEIAQCRNQRRLAGTDITRRTLSKCCSADARSPRSLCACARFTCASLKRGNQSSARMYTSTAWKQSFVLKSAVVIDNLKVVRSRMLLAGTDKD